MGKGDRKSRKGKRFMGSYGKTRPARKGKVKFMPAVKPASATPEADTAKKKAPAKKKAAAPKKKEPKD